MDEKETKPDEESEDTEGHMPFKHSVSPEGETEAEGQRRFLSPTDEDETKKTVSEDDEDVEGHRGRG